MEGETHVPRYRGGGRLRVTSSVGQFLAHNDRFLHMSVFIGLLFLDNR